MCIELSRKQAFEKFKVSTYVCLLNWVRERETGRTIYDLLGDRSRERIQCFPYVSARQCSSPKTGYQLYRPQFLTSRTLLANTSFSIDVLDPYSPMRTRDLSREQIKKVLSLKINVNYYVYFYFNYISIKLIW